MYYIKNLRQRAGHVRKDFSDAKQQLDFTRFVHADKRARVKKDLVSRDPLVPDIAGAVVAQLHYRGLLNESALRRGLEYCHDIVEDRGYRLVGLQSLHDGVKASNNHVILVAGCQTRPLWESRVHAAFELLKGVHVPFKIVFSGLHQRVPSGRPHRAETPDEAGAMERFFDSLIDRSAEFKRHQRFFVRLDRHSHSTKQNIVKFMTMPDVLDRRRPNHVFIVSSLFHLPRLVAAAEHYLRSKRVRCIHQIVLVGSEDHHAISEVVRHRRYVKTLFHQVFDHVTRGGV